MGTPDFAVPSLERIAATTDLTLVVTRPDVIQDVADRIFEKMDEEKE